MPTKTGPNYKHIKEALTLDKSSFTSDNLRGEAPSKGFTWTDRFNKVHSLYLNDGETYTCFFPVSNREVLFKAKGIDYKVWPLPTGNALRVGCGTEHRWAEVKFDRNGDCIRAHSSFYEDNNLTSKCTDWDNYERLEKNAEKGMSLLKDGVAIYTTITGK
jgi:hypothetical protein